MKKYFELLKYEAKTIIREPFQVFMCLLPVIMLLLYVYVIPLVLGTMDPVNEAASRTATLILIVFLISMGMFFIGAMGAFLLLDQKDERTISTIAVTPVGTSGYLMFKMVYIYFLSVVSAAIVLLGIKYLAADKYLVYGVPVLENLKTEHIIAYSFASSLFAPALALLQGALSKNKVEGFALVKGTGIFAMVPILILLEPFKGGLQYILGIFPNFWAIKALMLELIPSAFQSDLSFAAYLLIGVAYNAAIFWVTYKLFLKKLTY